MKFPSKGLVMATAFVSTRGNTSGCQRGVVPPPPPNVAMLYHSSQFFTHQSVSPCETSPIIQVSAAQRSIWNCVYGLDLERTCLARRFADLLPLRRHKQHGGPLQRGRGDSPSLPPLTRPAPRCIWRAHVGACVGRDLREGRLGRGRARSPDRQLGGRAASGGTGRGRCGRLVGVSVVPPRVEARREVGRLVPWLVA